MAIINGTAGNDIIDEVDDGGSVYAEDTVFAMAGDDRIQMHQNYNNVGDLTITDTVHGGDGNDTLAFNIYNSFTFGFVADPAGGYSGSYLEGAAGAWELDFDGIENFDVTVYTPGTLTLAGGSDRVEVITSGLHLSTGAGDDYASFIGSEENDVAMGAGNDRLVLDWDFAGSAVYLTDPFSGDHAAGYSGTYYIAGAYATAVFTGVEDFTILTGAGGDDLVTGDGDDVLTTNGGNDDVKAGMGDDLVDGGADIDSLSISFADESEGVAIDLLAAGQQQTGGTGSVQGFESFKGSVVGSAFADTLIEGVFDYDSTIDTGAGDDLVQVSRGSDTVAMGAGNDRLVLERSYVNAATYMTVALSGDHAAGYAGTFYTAGAYATTAFTGVEDFTIVTGAAGDDLVTGDGDDVLTTNGGNDDVKAGMGDDLVDGGADIDSLSISFADESEGVAIDLLAAGQQQTGGTGSVQGFESFKGSVVGSAFADTLIEGVFDYDSTIDTGAGDDLVQVSRGSDTVAMGAGNDRLVLDYDYVDAAVYMTVALNGSLATGYAGTYYIAGAYATSAFSQIENFTISTGAAADTLTTGDGADVIAAGGGADLVAAGRGNDMLDGGAGTDRLGIDLSDEAAGVTINLLLAGAQQSGGTGSVANFESFGGTVTGSAFADTLIEGNYAYNATINAGAGNDLVQVSRGTDVVDLGAGSDRLVLDYAASTASAYATTALSGTLATGYAGEFYVAGGSVRTTYAGVEHFTINGGSVNDTLATGDGADILSGMLGNDNLSAAGGNDQLDGGAGNDRLDGGAGVDTMTGGIGDDSYVVNSASEVLNEFDGEGSDTVEASIDFTLGNYIENLILVGAAIKGIGNALNNTITGNANANALYGGAGADSMAGGLGNDTYYVENVGDVVVEGSNGGGDTVSSSVSFTLGANIERLVLTGAAAINGTGNALANNMTGNGAANVLDGGAGADLMKGAGGNDTYHVDHLGDVVEEVGGGGTDIVFASVDYSVATQSIENLTLTGSAIKGTGNGLANTITGNAGANFLYGGGGADTLVGGLGNDNYFVDGVNDIVTEAAGEGTDTVNSAGSYVLGANLEVLRLTGTANINGTGNALANTLIGNANNNVLDGGAGADTMKGGAGDDSYRVDDAGDAVTELAGEGSDTVLASVSFTLAANVENLTLTGAGAINGTGNTLANTLNGNSAANTLGGGAGDDALHGGGAIDTLTGGAGLDTFWFETALGATNIDNITDFVAADDSLYLDRTIFTGIAANGALAAGAFQLGTAALDADDRILYDQATGDLWYDADGTGAAVAVQFAHVTAGTAMTAADFFAVP